jgi:hypothetical protein
MGPEDIAQGDKSTMNKVGEYVYEHSRAKKTFSRHISGK